MADYDIQQKVLNSGGTYDNLYPKSKAGLVDIVDTAGNFTATDVEGALAETAEQISTVSVDVDTHLADNVYDKETHGIRVSNDELQVYNSSLDLWQKLANISIDDKTGSPGNNILMAGDMSAGYFGIVSTAELFTGLEIASVCGITEGVVQFSDVGWLKFAIDGKIIFKSQKTYRHSISWNHINSKGCVDGTKVVSKNGKSYKVRLMKGTLTNPSVDVGGDKGAKGSEWNRLMLPIHIGAKTQSWHTNSLPFVEDNVPYWGIDFTNIDLHSDKALVGNGSYHLCQNTDGLNNLNMVNRGFFDIAYLATSTKSVASDGFGWSPVLEVVE